MTIQEQAHGRWRMILGRLGVDDGLLDGKHRPCPNCAGTDRFRFDNLQDQGTFICSQCGAGNGFSMVMKLSVCDFKKACEIVSGILGCDYSQRDNSEWREKMRLQRREAEQAKREGHRMATIEAQNLFDASVPACSEHPYLKRKKVLAHGILQSGDALIIPVRIGGIISSVQKIWPEGRKWYIPKSKIGSGYYPIYGCKLLRKIYVCEGFATGATVREVTGDNVAVAFDAGNLIKVARVIRGKMPHAEIIIAGDNDASKVGEKKGRAAAEAIGGKFTMPPEVGLDWNDYFCRYGKDQTLQKLVYLI